MKKFMKERLFDHIGLKLLSLIIAFVMWFIVMNIEDATITKTIENITVKMMNEDSILDSGRVYDVTNGATVDVVVKGPRSIVENLDADNFDAYADLSQLSVTNSTVINVGINSTLAAKKVKQVVVTPINQYVTLSIENEIEKSIPVKIINTGSVEKGYALGSAVPTPNMITVSGPESVLANIVEARAVVDVNGADKDIVSTVTVGCIDGYGAAVAKDNMSLSAETVSVTIPVYKTKTIPINVKVGGTPKEGYGVKEINFEPDSIEVAGPEDELKYLDSLEISDVIVTDSVDNIEKNIDVSEYLPNEVFVADSTAGEIAINVEIEKQKERELALNTSNLNIIDTTKDKKYSIVSPIVLKIRLAGFADVIDSLKVTNLNARVSAKDLKPGSYVLQVEFDNSDKYTVLGTYSVTLEVKEE